MSDSAPPARIAARPSRPLHPCWILLIAILLPGFGHVLSGHVKRGLIMQMFMISLAIVTWHITPPERSLVGRLTGGLFVYALTIPEAYRLARVRWLAAGAV